MTTRTSLLVAAGMLVAFGALALGVRQGLRFTVATPSQKLSEFPRQVDGWQGSEDELKEGVTKILRAADILSLRFDKGAEPPVFLHASTWTDPDSVRNACPHHPDVCYPAHGWVPQERKNLEVEVEGLGKVPVQAIVMRRGDEQVIVAYHFRIGDNVYVDEETAHAMHLEYFGTPVWPAVTKLMIQLEATDVESARPTIEKFVRAFSRWYRP